LLPVHTIEHIECFPNGDRRARSEIRDSNAGDRPLGNVAPHADIESRFIRPIAIVSEMTIERNIKQRLGFPGFIA
jgi:hypothetical protein